jgi:3-(3-hydroxy-phenyl)propionate hydroxylase
MGSYTYTPFAYRTPPELRGANTRRPVVVIGAGPVGLTCAIDLAMHGIPVVVLDDSDVVSVGSRAICWAKRTLEIFDRLGVGERMVAKGVTWSVGRVFHRDHEIYKFDLLPEQHHHRPAFINLQQYYVEQFLVERCADFPDLIDLRWKNEVTDVRPTQSGATLAVSTPTGTYHLDAEWVLACDGARSPTRNRMGLAFEGQSFEERFLIADVRMKADVPTERLFWFEPTFHAGQSALMHRQPDDVFRIDFQLGPDADPEREREPARVMERVSAVVGTNTPVELEWCSVYSFRCARMEKFVHGRIVFVGDSAHVVSPFGARGGNGGIQDADNLCWKLALVLKGEASEKLIATYDEERRHGADENILNSSRTTNFMTPKSRAERLFRDGVVALAGNHGFARALLNAGRLSRPCALDGLSLQTPDFFGGGVAAGHACVDAPVVDAHGRDTWLLEHLGGDFALLAFIEDAFALDVANLAALHPALRVVLVCDAPREITGATVLVDRDGVARARYAAPRIAASLVRPDAHVAARFAALSLDAIDAALARAAGRTPHRAKEAA